VARYFITFQFHGANYHGWQIQRNAVTVQETLNKCLSHLFHEEVYLIGCGRTDTGVHAKKFVAHFDLQNKIKNIDKQTFKLESMLPSDIGFIKLESVKDDAHARFDALKRSYQYHIMRKNNPFKQGLATYLYGNLDIAAMQEATALLHGKSDYGCFSKLHTQAHTNICDIFSAELHQKEQMLVFSISADRFLRNMVRAIVGTLIEIGRGKKTVDDMKKIIESKDRSLAGYSVPAHGLYLVEIEYPEDIYLRKDIAKKEQTL